VHRPPASAADVPVRVEIVTPTSGPASVLPDLRTVEPREDLQPMDPAAVYFGGTGLADHSFTKRQQSILLKPVDLAELDVLPTGEVYMSAVHVRRRLWAAFGVGAFGQRPRSMPKQQGSTVMQLWELVILGRSVDTTWGEAEYHEDNVRMSYASALEAAKSNALTRSCKVLGVGSECWDRKFCADYLATHAVKVHRHKVKDPRYAWQWRRLHAPSFYDEDAVAEDMPRDVIATWHASRAEQPRVEAQPSAADLDKPLTEPQLARLWGLMRAHHVTIEALHDYLGKHYAYTVRGKAKPSGRLIKRLDADAIEAWIANGGA
jgi:hypothetical protein